MLNLRRANKNPGVSSSGFWWVEEAPGLAISRFDHGWHVINVCADDIWDELLEVYGLRRRTFLTRTEAMASLDSAICKLAASHSAGIAEEIE